MKFKGWVLFLAFMSALQAQAGVYNYDRYLPDILRNYLQDMQYGSKSEGGRQCLNMYEPMLQDGVLDVVYSFGYFDVSTSGKPIIYDNVNYGYSPTLDGAAFNSVRGVLAGRCYSRQMRLCEFRELPGSNATKIIFEKQMQILGQSTRVRITMTRGSASESHSENTRGSLAETQKMISQQSEKTFFGGLTRADVVFYNGHSRNGGGPDFNPPILNKAMKTNYKGYYEVQKPGIKRVLSLINQNPNPGFIFGMFSCYSRMHFYKDIMSKNPQQKLILSAETIDYFDTTKASIGYLEGILRGLCGQDLADTAKKGDKIRNGFQGYQLK